MIIALFPPAPRYYLTKVVSTSMLLNNLYGLIVVCEMLLILE